MKRAVLILAVGYLLLLVAIWVAVTIDDGSRWPVTLFLLSPRWVTALPLAALIPLTLAVRTRYTWIYLVHGLLLVFPIMGYRLPLSRPDVDRTTSVLGVVTCNLGGGKVLTDDLVQLVHEHEIQVLILQECSPAVGTEIFDRLDWQHHQTRNIAIGSSFRLGEVRPLAQQRVSDYSVIAAISCELTRPSTAETKHPDRIQLVSLHLPTFRPALQRARHFDLHGGRQAFATVGAEYRRVASQICGGLQTELPTLIGGDFNVPCESSFYRDYWRNYHNAFGDRGMGFGQTKFTRYHGVRIDHLLCDEHWVVLQAFVGPSLGGDHRPVIAKLRRSDS